MYQIGRVCIKIAGRDAGMTCVIIDVLDKNHVLIDGQTRRRKCNVKHLEPTSQTVKVTKNAPGTEIIRVFKTLNIDIKETKPKKKAARPKRVRKKKPRPVKKEPVKKEPVKEVPEKKTKEEKIKTEKPTSTPGSKVTPTKPKAEGKK
ncbi:50S ribosomal protein L14e [Candidatus Woesearchaeota archaeon]|nr:50S ribosomal protein L14e [Candidatus Woesearchaeota archaeon]